MFTPAEAKAFPDAPNESAVMSYTVLRPESFGIPALGLATRGTAACGLIEARISTIASGPVEQLQPNAPAPRLCRVTRAESGSVPPSVRPSRSKVIVTMTKGSASSRTARSAALASWMSIIVSMAKRSTPPSRRPSACSRKIATASSKPTGPKGSTNCPVGPISPATSTSLPTASRARTADRRLIPRTSARPYSASFKRLAPKVFV